MRALVYTAPRTLEVQEVAPPQESDEIIVDVEACGICGSDMHAWMGHDDRRPAPLVLGHEVSGIARSGRFAGQRVTINPLVTCMRCPACLSGRTNLCAERQIISMAPRPGGFAQQIRVPERNLLPVPNHYPPEHAALVEPLAVAWHGVALAARATPPPLAAQDCLVLGGGAIGVAAALALRAQGAASIRIAETNTARRDFLSRLDGIALVEPPTSAERAHQADVIIDAVGIEATRRAASALARPGGAIVHIGLGSDTGGLDVRRLTLQEIAFLGAYTYTMQDFRETLAALVAGQFGEPFWIEERSLSEGAAAFDALAAGDIAAAKIILRI
ncbi:MAG: alcohol dehydrogenase catalytic domain-containing protein [Pseudomonadota bacterium]